MDFVKECELLRGFRIDIDSRNDPLPCNEASADDLLCRKPCVSVHMITYNHAKFIRQAIEGVMMQKTDFEYELVIGEDGSTDNTRATCVEYQRKHPDKIRVLWSESNVGVSRNSRRTLAHCRGEFVAYCEGDDYWTDPLKLQKQVDVMRRNANVSLCFCGGQKFYQGTGLYEPWDKLKGIPQGLISGSQFFRYHLFGTGDSRGDAVTFLITASTLVRKSCLLQAMEAFDIFNWKLALCDTTTWLGLALKGDVYYLPDEVCVYRITTTGACGTSNGLVWLDGFLARMWFARQASVDYLPWLKSDHCDGLRRTILLRLMQLPRHEAKRQYSAMVRGTDVFSGIHQLPLRLVVFLFGLNMFSFRWIVRFHRHFKLF